MACIKPKFCLNCNEETNHYLVYDGDSEEGCPKFIAICMYCLTESFEN